jgi:hypothetical protein
MRDALEVLSLFIIPIGGGIPAGVLLAKSRGIHWGMTTLIYLVSDLLLAIVFEPIMLGLIAGSRRFPVLAKVKEVLKQSVVRSVSAYGTKLGPLALVLIAFGVDPMTGRAAAAVSGHGFLTGWMIAITGDLIYFGVLMASTLWLNHILGDGTWTTIIILALMMGVPVLVRKIKESRKNAKQ